MKFRNLFACLLLALSASTAFANCTTQTLIVGGKLQVCTVCGTVVSCM